MTFMRMEDKKTEDKANDNLVLLFDLNYKLDRLNKNLEKQIRIWSWWAVLIRAIFNAIGYVIGLALLAVVLALLAGRVIHLPEVGALIDRWYKIISNY